MARSVNVQRSATRYRPMVRGGFLPRVRRADAPHQADGPHAVARSLDVPWRRCGSDCSKHRPLGSHSTCLLERREAADLHSLFGPRSGGSYTAGGMFRGTCPRVPNAAHQGVGKALDVPVLGARGAYNRPSRALEAPGRLGPESLSPRSFSRPALEAGWSANLTILSTCRTTLSQL
jgi:hypothetical protein